MFVGQGHTYATLHFAISLFVLHIQRHSYIFVMYFNFPLNSAAHCISSSQWASGFLYAAVLHEWVWVKSMLQWEISIPDISITLCDPPCQQTNRKQKDWVVYITTWDKNNKKASVGKICLKNQSVYRSSQWAKKKCIPAHSSEVYITNLSSSSNIYCISLIWEAPIIFYWISFHILMD